MTDVVVESNRAGNGAPGGRSGNCGDGVEGGSGNQGGQGGSGGEGGGLYVMRSLNFADGTVRVNRSGHGADGGAAGDGGTGSAERAGTAPATTSSRAPVGRAVAVPGSVSAAWTSP